MPTLRIAPTLDVFKHSPASLFTRVETMSIYQLAFQGGEEALAECVIAAISHRSHGGAHARFPAALAEGDRRVLGSLVGVAGGLTGTLGGLQADSMKSRYRKVTLASKRASFDRGMQYPSIGLRDALCRKRIHDWARRFMKLL